MELSSKEARFFKRNDSCNCNSTGVSSVKETSDELSSLLCPKNGKLDSCSCSGSGNTKSCLIDLTLRNFLQNLSDQLTALDTSTELDRDDEASQGDVADDKGADSASLHQLKRRRRPRDTQQIRSGNNTRTRSGRSCLISVTVASHQASARRRLRWQKTGPTPGGGTAAGGANLENGGSSMSLSEPLRALDTSSESGAASSLPESNTESSDSTDDVDDDNRVRSAVLLKKSRSASQFPKSRSSSSSSSHRRSRSDRSHRNCHRSRSLRRRRCTTEEETPSDSDSPSIHDRHCEQQPAPRRPAGGSGGNNANNTDNAQPVQSGDNIALTRPRNSPTTKATTTIPSAIVVLKDAAAGDAADFELKQCPQTCEQMRDSSQVLQLPQPSLRPPQCQQQLFTRSAESSRDSEGYSYNTVSTHCIDPWLPDLEATGTLDGCADYSIAAAAGRGRQLQFRTTTTQSATPSDSSTVMGSLSAAAAAAADEASVSDQQVFQSQLSSLRRRIYGGGAPDLIPPPVTWAGGKKTFNSMPKFPADTIESLAGVESPAKIDLSAPASGSAADEASELDQQFFQSQLSGFRRCINGDGTPALISPPLPRKERNKNATKMPKFSLKTVEERAAVKTSTTKIEEPTASKIKQRLKASPMKPKIIKKARTVQSIVPLPRPPAQKKTPNKKQQKTENPKKKQQQQQQQQQQKRSVKKNQTIKKQTTLSPSLAEITFNKLPEKSKSKLSKSKAAAATTIAQGATKASSAKRASGTKFVTFSRPVYM